MIEKLQKLGLSSYESRAYLTLLELGDAQADAIALNAKIPTGRIYNVLSNLEDAGLIHVQETRPMRYRCVEPDAALERLSENKKKELRHAAAEIETLVKEMASELSNVITIKSARSLWTVAKEKDSLELVREDILKAQKELLFFTACRTGSEMIRKELMNNRKRSSEIIEGLDKTIKNGVEVKVILNKEFDFSSIGDLSEVKQLLMHTGKGFDYRTASIPATPFGIIDGENLTLAMRNPLNPEEIFAVVSIRDSKLAEEFREKFFNVWEKADTEG